MKFSIGAIVVYDLTNVKYSGFNYIEYHNSLSRIMGVGVEV